MASPTINRRRRRRVKERLAESAGFTLVELLVAMSMFVVVMAAVLASLEAATTTASNEAERNEAISEVTTGVARMVADLQRAYQVNAPTLTEPTSTVSSSYMDVLIRVPGSGDQRIFYNCAYNEPKGSYDECVRYQQAASVAYTAGEAPTGVTPEVIIPHVMNETSSDPSDPVFSGVEAPSGSGHQPTLGTVTIHTPGKGGLSTSKYKHQVVIKNTFYLRQLDYGH